MEAQTGHHEFVQPSLPHAYMHIAFTGGAALCCRAQTENALL